MDTKLKTGIAESLREPLMKIAQQLLISDKATFEHLTPTEQKLWTTFETAVIYRFLTGEEDTVPEFQYNWTTVPRLQPLDPTNAPITSANAPPPMTPPTAPPPSSDTSTSPATSSPRSSLTPSTSGTRPKQTPPPRVQQPQPDPSGASTSGNTP